MKCSHAVIVTPSGRRGFRKTFGIDAFEAGDRRKPSRASAGQPRVDASITVEVSAGASERFGCKIRHGSGGSRLGAVAP
jgi:hypothetical protein